MLSQSLESSSLGLLVAASSHFLFPQQLNISSSFHFLLASLVILPIQVGTRLFSFSFPFIYTLQATLEDLFSGRPPLLGSSRSGATPGMTPYHQAQSLQYLSGVDTAGPATLPPSADAARERARSQVNPGNPKRNSGDQTGDRNPTTKH